jgi:hypothetical protein
MRLRALRQPWWMRFNWFKKPQEPVTPQHVTRRRPVLTLVKK